MCRAASANPRHPWAITVAIQLNVAGSGQAAFRELTVQSYDPLVYSDDGRLDTMIEMLTEASTRMQIIVLTCRERAFRHIPGNRILLGS